MADSDSDSFKSFYDAESHPPSTSQPAPAHPGSTHPHPHPRHRKPTAPPTRPAKPAPPPPPERFSSEEESALLASSHTLKARGNTLFGAASYENAIQTYDKALAECPNYLDYELAVLRSNVAACHLKLQEWAEATESADKGVECLERLEPLPELPKPAGKKDAAEVEEPEDGIEEVDDTLAARIENLRLSGHSLAEVRKLQVKLLMRRARARSEQGGWTHLQGADEDYRILLSPAMQPSLSPTDLRSVREATARLAPRLNSAKDQEMAEMMGKLKGLGNSILKPFGFSTDNFQFVKDEKSGGYSMNFNQGAGK